MICSLNKMWQPTIQSRDVVLTEDEKNYFAKATYEDLLKLDEELAKEREITKTNTNNGLSGVDYYNNLHGEQHTYNVSLVITHIKRPKGAGFLPIPLFLEWDRFYGFKVTVFKTKSKEIKQHLRKNHRPYFVEIILFFIIILNDEVVKAIVSMVRKTM